MFEHVEIVERALGHKLPRGAQVHHVDGNPANNAPSNLVVCPSQSYHKLLHARADAYAACGDYSRRECQFCNKYDDVVRLKRSSQGGYWHRACRNKYNHDRYHQRILQPTPP